MILEWGVLGDHINSLCNTLPYNCQLTIDKLKTLPQVKEDGKNQLSKLMSSSTNARRINERIITYLIVKLCYSGNDTDLARLCDIMEEMISFNSTSTCVQQTKCGKSVSHSYSNGFVHVEMALKSHIAIYVTNTLQCTW